MSAKSGPARPILGGADFGVTEHALVHSYSRLSCMHIKNGWDAPIGKILYCEREIGNRIDPHAVAVKRATLIGI